MTDLVMKGARCLPLKSIIWGARWEARGHGTLHTSAKKFSVFAVAKLKAVSTHLETANTHTHTHKRTRLFKEVSCAEAPLVFMFFINLH